MTVFKTDIMISTVSFWSHTMYVNEIHPTKLMIEQKYIVVTWDV